MLFTGNLAFFSQLFILIITQHINSSNALQPLYIKEKRFMQPSGNPNQADSVFFSKGIDYQPGGAPAYNPDSGFDVLSDEAICQRDATVFRSMGLSAIRVYTINPNLNHDACVTIFNDAGIYIFLDLNSPLLGESINRYEPWNSYNAFYFTRVFQVVEAFHNYPNIAGFFVGNEVINDPVSAKNSPKFIRAVQRDVKEYMRVHDLRPIPLGYSAADDLSSRKAIFDYLRCTIPDESTTDSSRSDFYGLNVYEWCNGNNWQTSGFQVLHDTFANSTIPIFFSEFGCNVLKPRLFEDVDEGLFGGLVDAFSGGLAFEYSEETNGFGIARINPDRSINLLEDYQSLKTQYLNAKIPAIMETDKEEFSFNADPSSFICNAQALGEVYGTDYADLSLPARTPEIQHLIDTGVTVAFPGKLTTVIPSPSLYNIFNTDGSILVAEIPQQIYHDETPQKYTRKSSTTRTFGKTTLSTIVSSTTKEFSHSTTSLRTPTTTSINLVPHFPSYINGTIGNGTNGTLQNNHTFNQSQNFGTMLRETEIKDNEFQLLDESDIGSAIYHKNEDSFPQDGQNTVTTDNLAEDLNGIDSDEEGGSESKGTDDYQETGTFENDDSQSELDSDVSIEDPDSSNTSTEEIAIGFMDTEENIKGNDEEYHEESEINKGDIASTDISANEEVSVENEADDPNYNDNYESGLTEQERRSRERVQRKKEYLFDNLFQLRIYNNVD